MWLWPSWQPRSNLPSHIQNHHRESVRGLQTLSGFFFSMDLPAEDWSPAAADVMPSMHIDSMSMSPTTWDTRNQPEWEATWFQEIDLKGAKLQCVGVKQFDQQQMLVMLKSKVMIVAWLQFPLGATWWLCCENRSQVSNHWKSDKVNVLQNM